MRTIGNNDMDNNPQEPSNAWIWIILFLLALIILFFAFGGGKVLDGTDAAAIHAATNGTQ